MSSVSLVSVFRQIRISRFHLFRSSVFQIRISRLDLFSSSVFQIRIDGSWAKWQCDGSFQIRTPCSNPHFSSSKSALPKSAILRKKPHGRVSRLLLDLLAHFAQLLESAKSVELKSAKSALFKSASVFLQIRQIRIFQIRTRFFVKSIKSAFSNPHAFFCQIRQIRIFKSASVFCQIRQIRIFKSAWVLVRICLVLN